MRKPETLPQCNRALSDPEQFRREKWMGPFPCPNSALMEGKPTVQQQKMYAINFSGTRYYTLFSLFRHFNDLTVDVVGRI